MQEKEETIFNLSYHNKIPTDKLANYILNSDTKVKIIESLIDQLRAAEYELKQQEKILIMAMKKNLSNDEYIQTLMVKIQKIKGLLSSDSLE